MLRLRLLACAFALLAQGQGFAARAAQPFVAGAYSFSDERGGFIIHGISGTGSRVDPVVVRQELLSASPVTMVIRAVRPLRPISGGTDFATGFIHVRLETLNNSGLGWIEFQFELQEIERVPSVFGDGLSFDQRRSQFDTVSSDRFRQYSRDFEPYDRLLFTDGKADVGESASFGFFISDFTPKATFFLVQDPRIPAS